MQLEPGMRVRCVEAIRPLIAGETYTLGEVGPRTVTLREISFTYRFFRDRFKPIVRVKAKCVPSLDLLIKRAVAAFDAMSSEEKATHRQAQRESWVRSEVERF